MAIPATKLGTPKPKPSKRHLSRNFRMALQRGTVTHSRSFARDSAANTHVCRARARTCAHAGQVNDAHNAPHNGARARLVQAPASSRPSLLTSQSQLERTLITLVCVLTHHAHLDPVSSCPT